MNKIFKINFSGRKRLTSLLGLNLDGSRLDGVVLRRVNGTLQVQKAFTTTLSLDPVTAAPELVGREIRNALEAAGVRERHCVLGMPPEWTLTMQTELPPLPEADAANLLQMEAERGFPCDVTTLRLAHSLCALAGDKKYVTIAGALNAQLDAVERVLAAAKLKPVSFSSAVTALQPPGALFGVPHSGGSVNLPPKGGTPGDNNGVLALVIGEGGVSLQVTCGGGVAALRSLEGVVEEEGSRRVIHTAAIVRETRITLGQLPAELSAAVRRVRVFGPADLARELTDALESKFAPAGLKVEHVTQYAPDEFGVEIPGGTVVSPAFSLAARLLAGAKPVFEFLPPRPTALQQILTRYSSGRWRSVVGTAAGVIVLVGGLFLFQEIQLLRLQSQWSGMAVKVKDLEGVQQQIQQYRPWFDESFNSLSILKQLTLAFPEDGAVTAKTIEIRNGGVVNCSGTAQDNTALLKMLTQLRSSDGVTDLKVDQIRGKSPMQFTFDFHWNKGGGNEN
jgi:hypothetical protein